MLGVPALIKTEDGLAERPAADLDKSVRQRVAEGSLEVAFDPASRPPGSGLSLSIEGDTLVLRSRLRPLLTLLSGPMLLLGVAALVSKPLTVHYLSALAGWLDVYALVVGGAGLAWQALAVEELLVSPRDVRRRLVIGRWAIAESALPSDEIEEVVIATPQIGTMSWKVQAIADSGTVSFGMMLSKAQRRWYATASLPSSASSRAAPRPARPGLLPASSRHWPGICTVYRRGGRATDQDSCKLLYAIGLDRVHREAGLCHTAIGRRCDMRG